ncbi:MAG TPA: cellulase family glycosylhydrolase, partial [Opitutaceae bacterium]|nr:cellulase family glycosylhydrolase [Opitutaceae bacterium]
MHVSRALLAIASVLFGLAVPAVAMSIENPPGFEIHRGVNLSHWLSQCPPGLDRNAYLTADDIAFIHRIGYDHVRLPIDEVEMWTADGKRIASAFQHLTNALDWCRRNDLRVIVDLHTVRSHDFNAEDGKNTLWTHPAAQAKFLKLWEDLSSVLKPYPDAWVAYEIMNEPVADNPEDWNKLVARAVADIRSREPNRVLVIGSNRWQGAATFPQLKVPAGDPNIILSVHDYEPFAFTHHT